MGLCMLIDQHFSSSLTIAGDAEDRDTKEMALFLDFCVMLADVMYRVWSHRNLSWLYNSLSGKKRIIYMYLKVFPSKAGEHFACFHLPITVYAALWSLSRVHEGSMA